MVLLGGIQPQLIDEVITKRKLDNGFAERILYIWPDDVVFPKWSESTTTSFVIGGWKHVAEYLMNAPQCQLTFSDKAKMKYIKYYNDLQKSKQEAFYKGDAHHLSMNAKFQINALELVTIIHYLCSNTPGSIYELPQSNVISELEMDCTLEFMAYFETQFQKVLCKVSKQEQAIDNYECIRHVWRQYIQKHNPNATQSSYAEILGIDRGNLNRILNKK